MQAPVAVRVLVKHKLLYCFAFLPPILGQTRRRLTSLVKSVRQCRSANVQSCNLSALSDSRHTVTSNQRTLAPHPAQLNIDVVGVQAAQGKLSSISRQPRAGTANTTTVSCADGN